MSVLDPVALQLDHSALRLREQSKEDPAHIRRYRRDLDAVRGPDVELAMAA